MMQKHYIVVPNWNGADYIRGCLNSLVNQSLETSIIVVDNGSNDSSVEILEKHYPQIILIKNRSNLGFAGGVNTGIRYAIKLDAKYVALLNNDAIAEKDWFEQLVNFLDDHSGTGIATSKIADTDKKTIDSTGEDYSIWGLPFSRGRGEPYSDKHDNDKWVFGASGGASIYRVKMLREVGLFDKDFFAYYEDVDLSFRAQLAGWKVAYVPAAKVYHQIGATSGKIYGFTTYHTLKNLPLLLWKNVPLVLMPKIWPRLALAYLGFVASALSRRQFGPVLKGLFMATVLWPKKLFQRWQIQRNRKVSTDYIKSILAYDLPPNAHRLRTLRRRWWKLTRKATS